LTVYSSALDPTPQPATASPRDSAHGGEHAIVIRNVSKTFGTTRAVRNLDLDVPAGSLCGFLGPNGAGKSTTIRMVMSIIHPDAGTIRVLGGTALESKDRIGYLPEERGLYRKMRVGEFLEYLGRLKGLSGREARRRSSQWLERVALGRVVRKRCHELSKGMQQKVQFIAAVLHEPELLILDEPFSGLDPVNAALLNTLIREMNEQGRTIIFSTHILHQAEQLCDRIFLINHGVKLLDATLDEVRAEFDPRTILARLESRRVPAAKEAEAIFTAIEGVVNASRVDDGVAPGGWELHLTEDADPHAVMREVAAAAPLRSIELRQLSLDEVFVRLVMQDEGREAAERARQELAATSAH
jgi:ABC-2 type transport system ATP-binding protein